MTRKRNPPDVTGRRLKATEKRSIRRDAQANNRLARLTARVLALERQVQALTRTVQRRQSTQASR